MLIRAVRLTIETNTLTGICFSPLLGVLSSNLLFSHLSHYNHCALCGLSRKQNLIYAMPVIHNLTRSPRLQKEIYYMYLYVLLVCRRVPYG